MATYPPSNKTDFDRELYRNTSAETDDSPFTSSLTTPVDENLQPIQNIYTKLHTAKKNDNAVGYFGIRHSVSSSIWPRVSPPYCAEVAQSPDELQGNDLCDLKDEKCFISSESEGGLAGRQRMNSFYTLPNKPISIDKKIEDVYLPVDSVLTMEGDTTVTWNLDLSFLSLASLMVRIVLFLPWCSAVGGSMLLFPDFLGVITFQMGYLPARHGIHRFAYWADCGMQHCMIFLLLLGTVVCYYPFLGFSIAAGFFTRFVYVWRDFVFRENTPLGSNDRHSIYVMATRCWFDGSNFDVRKRDDHFIIYDRNDTNERLPPGEMSSSEED